MRANYYLALIFGLVHGMGFANTARVMISKSQSLLPITWIQYRIGIGTNCDCLRHFNHSFYPAQSF
jgi:hypothetical protein